MLKNGYIRIGKYFTRPYEVPSSDRIHCSPKYVSFQILIVEGTD